MIANNSSPPMRADTDALAIAALSTIAADPDMLSRFLAFTGHDATDIRRAAREPEFLASVLHFAAEHEPVLLAAAASLGLAPEAASRLLAKLSRGDEQT